MASPARRAAFHILLSIQQHQAYASELLHSERLRDLSAADRALCTNLVMGVLRWRSRLDQAVSSLSSQPLQKLDIEVLTALRLGAYQMGFLRVPTRAAVHESVELVKTSRKRSAAPFVNAILRKLSSASAPLPPPLREPQTAAQVAGDLAHPLWLVERWAASFGIERAANICRYDQVEPETVIRLPDPQAEAALRQEGIATAPGALLRDARRVVSGDVTRTRAFRERRVAIQDEASQLIALLVGRGSRILDCCAAPGRKTAVMAELNPQAGIIAAELHPHRAALTRRLVAATNVHVLAADATSLPLAGEFDRVLADVPCSGTGTLARHPEIKWRLQPGDLTDLHQRQVAILLSALQHLAPGGRMVYSTCSLEREENEEVVRETLSCRSDCRPLDCGQELQLLQSSGELIWRDLASLTDGPFLRTLPGVHPCDGFFAAIIEK